VQRRTFLVGSAAAAATAAMAAVSGSALHHRAQLEESAGRASNYRSPDPTATALSHGKAQSGSPNVLFIALDDCNDWVGFLANHPGTKTPNLDALAAKSLSFTKAYCVAPMCNPARTGIMFGSQPFTGGVYDHSEASFQRYYELAGTMPSLVEEMSANGYTTIGAGKVFNDAEKNRWRNYRATDFWADIGDRKPPTPPERWDPNWISPYDGKPENDSTKFTIDEIDFGPSGKNRDDDPEGQASQWVAERLKDDYDSPFFLAYGAVCTHVPWRIPQQFFDMHPLEDIVLPKYMPEDLDDLSDYVKTHIIDQVGVFKRLVKQNLWAPAVQAYQAAISYADDCVGRVLDQLASSPYADDTIVMVWSDHGFHMGEKMHIEKFTIWEHGTHVPFLLHVPGKFASGQTFEKPVSTIDIGPTLVDLIGGEMHSPKHEGKSLLPAIADPALADDRPPIMTWRVGNNAVRRDNWRYIRYVSGDVELYDQSNDPEELTNLASRPETKDIQRQLEAFLPPIPPGTKVDPPSLPGGGPPPPGVAGPPTTLAAGGTNGGD
jgi:arylsulfatase A-like enzyme